MPIYAAFTPEGTCLYVGQTTRHPAHRWVEHATESPWAARATRWEVLPDLTEAAAFERLRPLHGEFGNASKRILERGEHEHSELVAMIDSLASDVRATLLHLGLVTPIEGEMEFVTSWLEAIRG